MDYLNEQPHQKVDKDVLLRLIKQVTIVETMQWVVGHYSLA